MKPFLTVKKEGIYEEVIDKSRFIGYCKPIESVEEATGYIAELKAKYKDSTHVVSAYLFGENNEVQRYSEDGEPQGTSAMPIISMLKNEEIRNTIICVVRYFGGIKLGTGGLVRAYTHMAKMAMAEAVVVEIRTYSVFKARISYELHGKLSNFIETGGVATIEDTEFTDVVSMSIKTKVEDFKTLESQLIDLCNGNINIYDYNEILGG